MDIKVSVEELLQADGYDYHLTDEERKSSFDKVNHAMENHILDLMSEGKFGSKDEEESIKELLASFGWTVHEYYEHCQMIDEGLI